MRRWVFTLDTPYEDVTARELKPGDLFIVLPPPMPDLWWLANNGTILSNIEPLIAPDTFLLYVTGGEQIKIDGGRPVRRARYVDEIGKPLNALEGLARLSTDSDRYAAWQQYKHKDILLIDVRPGDLIWITGFAAPVWVYSAEELVPGYSIRLKASGIDANMRADALVTYIADSPYRIEGRTP